MSRRLLFRLLPILPLTLALTALPRCNSGSSPTSPAPRATPTPTPATRAALSVVVDPDPIVHGGPAFGRNHSMQFRLRLHESAGLGGNIDQIEYGVIDSVTGQVEGYLSHNPAELIAHIGTNHIAAMGNWSAPLNLGYSLPGGRATGTLVVVVHFSDDRGNVIEVRRDTAIQ